MKSNNKINYGIALFAFSLLLSQVSKAQVLKVQGQTAFKKGCLLVSISEGVTSGIYSTSSAESGKAAKTQSEIITGERDPLIVEFGLTDRWGIGLTTGADIFKVSPSTFYGFRLQDNKDVTATTSEFTFDLNYHVFASKKTDISVFTSLGLFNVAFNGKNGDYNYNYRSNGSIIRIGSKIRYYFYKRLGAFGMVSYYTGTASPKNVKGNTVGNNISTTITGGAIEIGLCYRFF